MTMFQQQCLKKRSDLVHMLCTCLILLLLSANHAIAATTAPAKSKPQNTVPFGVGEQLNYDVLLDSHKVGTAHMLVEDIQKVRGHLAYHIVYTISAKAHFLLYTYALDDRFESWLDTEKLVSLRYEELEGQQKDGDFRTKRTYNIFPETAFYEKYVYRHDSDEEEPPVVDPGVHDPLDPCSLVYFVRTNPLHTSDFQKYEKYFKKDHNPVTLRADSRQTTMPVPSTVAPELRTNTVVVHPTVQDRGMFSRNASAEIWFTDDARYLPVKIAFHENVGIFRFTVSLRLSSYRPPDGK